MKYRCVDCQWEFEVEGNNEIKKYDDYPEEMRDHLFFNEHHGFVPIKD